MYVALMISDKMYKSATQENLNSSNAVWLIKIIIINKI